LSDYRLSRVFFVFFEIFEVKLKISGIILFFPIFYLFLYAKIDY